MAVVSVPHHPPWFVAKWAFRELFERLEASLESDDDKHLARQAIALDGLSFGLLDETTGARLARHLTAAAESLRSDVVARGPADPRDPEFAESLSELELRLSDVAR